MGDMDDTNAITTSAIMSTISTDMGGSDAFFFSDGKRPTISAATDDSRDDYDDEARIILHLDYDCFYAQVVENRQPALKSLPLGIKQKSILATCNYVARSRGVKKLMLISEAKNICPDLVLVEGEDLSPFRDVSKVLYRLLRSYSWNGRVERLGLDEVFLDVSDLVSYNLDLLNPNDPFNSFFCLSRTDPELGFAFDATGFAGCLVAPTNPTRHSGNVVVIPPEETEAPLHPLRKALLLASHLAYHLRLQVEQEGYTSTCGIATNKLLAKVAGTKNKPRDQTTLLALSKEDTLAFVDPHPIRSLPGIGGSMAAVIEQHLRPPTATPESPLTAGQVRHHPDFSPQLLEIILQPLGMERGIGKRTYQLLHGIDTAQVKPAADFPSQISIEDTYASTGISTLSQVTEQLTKLCASLIRRMNIDLTDTARDSGDLIWLARPRTLRLTTRPRHPSTGGPRPPYNSNRASRSQPLPGFVISAVAQPVEDIATRLVDVALLPMFHRLNPQPGPGQAGYNIGLLNICVANMAPSGADSKTSSGRDIAGMFRRQHDVLREFTVYVEDNDDGDEGYDGRSMSPPTSSPNDMQQETASDSVEEDEGLETDWDGGAVDCELCGHVIPAFATLAHRRFHQLGGDG